MSPFKYSPHQSLFTLRQNKIDKYHTHFRVTFTSEFCGSHQRKDTVNGEYYLPQKGRNHKFAIMLHGNGKRSAIPLQLLAKSLVKRGIACFILYLAIHPNRMPEEMRKRYPRLSLDEWFEIHQTSVIEVRQIIDWANTREELNPKKISILGLSFGGSISAIVMGIDSRIVAGIIVLTGGNNEKIHHDGGLGIVNKSYKRTEDEYQQIQKSYLKYLNDVIEKGLDETVPARKGFLIDPMTYAHHLRKRPVLMINARWDEMIPKEATLDFWNQAGKPPLALYPATHATIWLYYYSIRKKISRFLDSVFTA